MKKTLFFVCILLIMAMLLLIGCAPKPLNAYLLDPECLCAHKPEADYSYFDTVVTERDDVERQITYDFNGVILNLSYVETVENPHSSFIKYTYEITNANEANLSSDRNPTVGLVDNSHRICELYNYHLGELSVLPDEDNMGAVQESLTALMQACGFSVSRYEKIEYQSLGGGFFFFVWYNETDNGYRLSDTTTAFVTQDGILKSVEITPALEEQSADIDLEAEETRAAIEAKLQDSCEAKGWEFLSYEVNDELDILWMTYDGKPCLEVWVTFDFREKGSNEIQTVNHCVIILYRE